ncbi:MAG: efflux RND transporter permease subunit [Candidatus Cryptobacteroides sp.]
MNVKTFIYRPIFSAVISIVIVLLGVIGLVSLPIEQYPDISTPTVQVEASYTGANAQTVQKSVIIPLEEKINGVENMIYMTSEADNNGNATIKVYFAQGTDADMATVNVQNRVSEASGQLPADVTKSGVKVSKQQSSQVMIFNLYSSDDRFDDLFLCNYLKINIVPRILRIQGVGGVNVIGSDYAIRVWLNPELMAQYGLSPMDISAAIGKQNMESPTGNFGENSENTFQYAMKYRGRYETPEEFGNIVIRALPDGEVLRLKDVADVELGAQDYSMNGEADGHPGTTCMITQIAGSNANEIVSQVEALFDEIQDSLPPGVKISVTQNVKDFLDASIRNVLMTLLEAMLLVVLVVYLFLQNGRLTLIPTISMLVSMIGTFFILSLLGFSINLLTLFALVLSIGTVVDNAIIVVEAVQAKLDGGAKTAYRATVDGMKGITPAILVSTLVFMAVFIPVSFISGTSGKFFQQFGLTMAVAVGLSALNALTLSPALCALLLNPADDGGNGKPSLQQRFKTSFNTAFSAMTAHYGKGVGFLIRHKVIACSLLVIALVLLVVAMANTKTGLVPNEDQGMFFINVSTAPGNSLYETKSLLQEVEDAIKDIPQIQSYAKNPGFGVVSGKSATAGLIIVRLKPWDERKGKNDGVDAVIAEVYRRTASIKGADIFAYSPPMVVGFGMTDGFEMCVQDKAGGDISDFYDVTMDFVAKLNERPEIGMAYTSFNVKFPQYSVEVDAAKCIRAGVDPDEVLSVISGYYGGIYSSDINRFSKVYRVMIQASPEYRLGPESLDNVFVRTSGGMAPIRQFVTLDKTYGPEILSRFNMFGSISVNGAPAEGYSSGDAILAIEETADKCLPSGYGYEFSGMTREESGSTDNTVIIMVLCIILVFLILSALYESFIIPLAVILSVPIGLMGSFLITWVCGLENNIYLQTGVIMLIGLLSKTAILITELAQRYRAEGMSINDAALRAAKERLRPILMTALTMIVGLLPLVFSSGAGANGNISLGVGTSAGMTIGTLALLFITPVLFTIMQKLQEKIKRTDKGIEECETEQK